VPLRKRSRLGGEREELDNINGRGSDASIPQCKYLHRVHTYLDTRGSLKPGWCGGQVLRNKYIGAKPEPVEFGIRSSLRSAHTRRTCTLASAKPQNLASGKSGWDI